MANLIAPFINDWHVDVIYKGGHFTACRRSVRCTDTFVHKTFDGTLKHEG